MIMGYQQLMVDHHQQNGDSSISSSPITPRGRWFQEIIYCIGNLQKHPAFRQDNYSDKT